MMAGAKVAIMAGGTGGHVFPALAVADQLRDLGCAVFWIGTPRGIENRVVPEAGYPLNIIPVSGLRGKGITSLLAAPFQLTRALVASLKILAGIQPNLVLGFGGFVAGPVGLAARLRGDSLAIHEQNAYPGTTNRILASWANAVLTGFPDALPRSVCVGNPVREEILRADKSMSDLAGRPSNILILGGSQGARSLNQMVPAALQQLAGSAQINIRHQCGPRWIEETSNLYQELGLEAEVLSFIDDMSQAYAWSDLIVCRAGAMTVAEVAAMGRAALFVPFPYAIDDHQTANANWLVAKGGAELIQEAEITTDSLASKLQQMVLPENLQKMALASAAASFSNSTDRIVSICEELIDESR
jgi:UDP-N-acetylglucosamine--N-acetylmuramyl-(pentapeptide) pyrophosphoryl-undecaprenol N-acetylglucosamine transferase